MAFHRACFALILCVSSVVWSPGSASGEEKPNVKVGEDFQGYGGK
jgi:hypothetical protein